MRVFPDFKIYRVFGIAPQFLSHYAEHEIGPRSLVEKSHAKPPRQILRLAALAQDVGVNKERKAGIQAEIS